MKRIDAFITTLPQAVYDKISRMPDPFVFIFEV